jgi:hypothetical protein
MTKINLVKVNDDGSETEVRGTVIYSDGTCALVDMNENDPRRLTTREAILTHAMLEISQLCYGDVPSIAEDPDWELDASSREGQIVRLINEAKCRLVETPHDTDE